MVKVTACDVTSQCGSAVSAVSAAPFVMTVMTVMTQTLFFSFGGNGGPWCTRSGEIDYDWSGDINMTPFGLIFRTLGLTPGILITTI
jgi:hypothetical protein